MSVAPAIFQETMDKLTLGMCGTAAYLDDVIVSGLTLEIHNKRVQDLFKRLNNFGLKVKLEKCFSSNVHQIFRLCYLRR